MAEHTADGIEQQLDECHANCDASFEITTDSKDPRVWHVTIKDFTDGSINGRIFQKQLQEHAERYRTDGYVHLRCSFPASFPARPPALRLVRPILIKRTGATEGGAFCIPALFEDGWDAGKRRMFSILAWVKAAMIAQGAEVDMRTANAYPDEAFLAAQGRLQSRKSMVALSNGRIGAFAAPFVIVSASFAQQVFGDDELSIPRDFEQGNRLLVPADVFASVSSLLSSRAFVLEAVGHQGVRTYCGIAGAHTIAVKRLGGMGERFVIAPDSLFASLHTPDASQVALRPVELPKLNFLQILPLSASFAELDAPKEFLQMALSRYTCITMGEVVTFVEGTRDLSFYVTAMHPAVPAATVWTGDWEAKLTLDILPAQDDPDRVPRRLRKHAAGAVSGGGQALDWSGGAAAARPSILGHDDDDDDDVEDDVEEEEGSAPQGGDGKEADDDDSAASGAGGSSSSSSSAVSPSASGGSRGRNADFAAWRARQQQLQDERDEEQLRNGVPCINLEQQLREGGKPNRVKVRTMPVPLSPDLIPADVVVRVTDATTCAQLYTTVRGSYTPPGVPFYLVKARDGSVVPDAQVSLGTFGLLGTAVEQRVIPGDSCDACAQEAREKAEQAAAAAAARGQATPSTPSPPASPGASATSSSSRLDASLARLHREVKALEADATSSGTPSKWECGVCTVLAPWSARTCPVCSAGERPSAEVAKVALYQAAQRLKAQYEALREEVSTSQTQGSDAGRPGAGASSTAASASAAAAASASSSSAAAAGGSGGDALQAVGSSAFEAWMVDDSVDEAELPHRLVMLRRKYRKVKRDARTGRSSPPSRYICRRCSLVNDWRHLHCASCRSIRPSPRAARMKLAEYAADLVKEAKQLHASVASQSLLSRSASASGTLSPMASASSGFEEPADDGSSSSSGEATASLDTPPGAQIAPTASASSPDGLKTYIVFGGTVSLCSKHPCHWLDELYRCQQLDDADLPLLTVQSVLEMREAKLL